MKLHHVSTLTQLQTQIEQTKYKNQVIYVFMGPMAAAILLAFYLDTTINKWLKMNSVM